MNPTLHPWPPPLPRESGKDDEPRLKPIHAPLPRPINARGAHFAPVRCSARVTISCPSGRRGEFPGRPSVQKALSDAKVRPVQHGPSRHPREMPLLPQPNCQRSPYVRPRKGARYCQIDRGRVLDRVSRRGEPDPGQSGGTPTCQPLAESLSISLRPRLVKRPAAAPGPILPKRTGRGPRLAPGSLQLALYRPAGRVQVRRNRDSSRQPTSN
jgi:hypothetical protein